MHIRTATEGDISQWLVLRLALWPDCPPPEHKTEIQDSLGDQRLATFVAETEIGAIVGFLEASLRDYAEGCTSQPVGYIEGWYVLPQWRRQGVGRRLVQAAEQWAVGQGCREMGSDLELDNEVSLRSHLALGYAETERLIHMLKPIGDL